MKSVSIATHTICLTALASLAMGASSWLATSALLKKSPTAASNTPKSKGASSAKKDDIQIMKNAKKQMICVRNSISRGSNAPDATEATLWLTKNAWWPQWGRKHRSIIALLTVWMGLALSASTDFT